MLKVGKIDSELLKKIIFDKIKYRRKEVTARPGIGEDCAVIDFEKYDCVISTDPITASVNDIGRLAIHITCNDIASNGVQPIGIMLAVMLPVGTTENDIEKIMTQASETAKQLEVEIIGGHTEITTAVNKPIIVSTAIGRGIKTEENSNHDIEAGDVILITKKVGIEGTGIIVSDNQKEVEDILSSEEIEKAKSFLDDVSVLKEGIIAGNIGTCGMHDVTEGGILGAVYEMCIVADKGATIYEDKIPVDEITLKIAEKYDINHLKLISSGCMLIIAKESKKQKIINEIKSVGIEIAEIGHIKEKTEGIKIFTSKKTLEEILPPDADELYKVVK